MNSPLTAVLIALLVIAFAVSVQLFRKLKAARARFDRDLEKLAASSGDKAERAGAEMRRTLAMLQSMNEGVLVVDHDERILLANAVFTDVIGVPHGTVEGKFYWEVIRDAELNGFIRRALSERVLLNAEHELLLSDRIFQTQVSPVFGKEEFLGTVAVLHDVTRLKELERQRTEFVANVSHELKTPLTSIMGFVETLKEGAADDPKDRAHFLEIIEDQSKVLYRLIEDLLLLSKIESGRQPLKSEKVDIKALTEKVLRAQQKNITARSVKVALDIPPAFMVTGDPDLIEQALSNLIDNAIKYNTDGGQLSVRAFAESGMARIQISDTGHGIPSDDLPRIFERFYRAEKGRSRDAGGTGLGLSIVKHIAERHGGTVAVRSTPKQGSVFTLSFPRTP